jgi:hypothetical protein
VPRHLIQKKNNPHQTRISELTTSTGKIAIRAPYLIGLYAILCFTGSLNRAHSAQVKKGAALLTPDDLRRHEDEV